MEKVTWAFIPESSSLAVIVAMGEIAEVVTSGGVVNSMTSDGEGQRRTGRLSLISVR